LKKPVYKNLLLTVLIIVVWSFSSCTAFKDLFDSPETTIAPAGIVINSPEDFDYSNLVNDSGMKPIPACSWSQSLRGAALSPDGSLIYTGVILGAPTGNKLVLAYYTASGLLAHTNTYGSASSYAKAVAVHSSGRVYYALGNSDLIAVYDSDLQNRSFYGVDTNVGLTDIGDNDFDPQGLTVYGNYLYVTSDQLVRVYRFNLDPNNGDILSHDSSWASGTGYVTVGASMELTGLAVNPADGSIWVPSEDEDLVYRITEDGSSFAMAFTNHAGSSPHDIAFFGDYALVTFGSSDGTNNVLHGVGVYKAADFQYVTTLADTNSELRNAQGVAVDTGNKTIYVVDGYYGAPNDFSVAAPAYDTTAADIIMSLQFNK